MYDCYDRCEISQGLFTIYSLMSLIDIPVQVGRNYTGAQGRETFLDTEYITIRKLAIC